MARVDGEDKESAGAESLSGLFERLAIGRADALAEIYAACADEVHGLALWRTGSAHDARLGKVRNPLAYIRRMTHSATLVLTDKDAMRLQTAQRFTVFEPGVQVEGVDSGELSLRINDEELDSIVRLTGELAERRFRFEGLIALLLVKHLGSPGQQETATAALVELAKDPDETFCGLAASYRDTQMSKTDLREWVKSWQ